MKLLKTIVLSIILVLILSVDAMSLPAVKISAGVIVLSISLYFLIQEMQ